LHTDFNSDGIINLSDFSKLAQYWLLDEPSVDIFPLPSGDGIVNLEDLAVLGQYWRKESAEVVYIQWLGHASVKVWTADVVIYVDPQNLSGSPHDATLVLVTHQHSDHYSAADIAKVSGPTTPLIVAAKVVTTYGTGQAIAPGQTFDLPGLHVIAVPAYNINKTNHPKSDNLLGFIIELAGKRIYVAGDTDLIPEMQTLGKIDVAFLPAGGAYTMNATEAAQAATIINPTLAIPYHWGTIVGTLADAQLFARLAACNAKVMSAPDEIISSQDWQKDFSLMAHWKLDETGGAIVHDSVAGKDGALSGNPIWQPAGGKMDGALQLDGADDYVSTPFVVNPADGPLSVFAWIKGGAPGQVIISQIDAVNWLAAGASQGKLMTELKSSGRLGGPLFSEAVIIDGDWHRVGLTWDGSTRILYVDDVEVAKDTQSGLAGSTGGLYIGAGSNLGLGSFWSGLLDDVRIHSRAAAP
jgi:L-ascorbate metabolism protein UlaG (beta-lactamase superfamily)